jgi:hypothetical protein
MDSRLRGNDKGKAGMTWAKMFRRCRHVRVCDTWTGFDIISDTLYLLENQIPSLAGVLLEWDLGFMI